MSFTRNRKPSFIRKPAPYSRFAISKLRPRNWHNSRSISSRLKTSGSFLGLVALTASMPRNSLRATCSNSLSNALNAWFCVSDVTLRSTAKSVRNSVTSDSPNNCSRAIVSAS